MEMKNFRVSALGKQAGDPGTHEGWVCHIHPPDGSTQLLPALAGQKSVIELGRGRRHRLSGVGDVAVDL